MGNHKVNSPAHLRLPHQIERDIRSTRLHYSSNQVIAQSAAKRRKGVIVTPVEGAERHYASLNDCYLLGGYGLQGVKDCCNGLRTDVRGVKFRWAPKE